MIAARLLMAAAACWAAEAVGHAGLAGSNPPDGAKLAAAPAEIELRFNEPVTPLSLRLFAGSAAPVALHVPPAASEVLRVALPPGLGTGNYALSFRVTSLDSHPVGGSIAFTVGDAAAAAPAAAERDALRGWRIAVRAVRDFALLIAAGGALFFLFVGRFAGDRALLIWSAAVGAAAAVLGTGLQGASMLGPGASVLGHDAWQTAFHSSFGVSACAAAGGALLIASGAVARVRARLVFLALGALLAVASFPLTGHAAGAGPGPLGQAAIAAHALAAAFWTGSLCALLRTSTPEVLRRFSRLGMVAVALLLAAGITFSVLQLPSLADLTGSDYGRLILGKAMLLAGLLALASLNRFRFLPSLERGDAAAAGRLRRSIGGELALIACVVALTALLVQTPPPRLKGVAEAGFTQTLQAMGRVAELSVSPARAGRNALSVRFRDFDPEEVFIAVSNPAAGVEPEPRPMKREASGHYARDGAELVFPGTWTVEVQARIGDFDQVVFRAEVPVR